MKSLLESGFMPSNKLNSPKRRNVLFGGLMAAGALAFGLENSQQAHAMVSAKLGNSHDTARNQFVEIGGVRYAYRRFGKKDGMPIVLLQHFIGTMDW